MLPDLKPYLTERQFWWAIGVAVVVGVLVIAMVIVFAVRTSPKSYSLPESAGVGNQSFRT